MIRELVAVRASLKSLRPGEPPDGELDGGEGPLPTFHPQRTYPLDTEFGQHSRTRRRGEALHAERQPLSARRLLLHRLMITLMQAKRKVMERGRFCFVASCFAAALWLLTEPENAWPLTPAGGVAPGSQASATFLGVDTTTSGDWIGHYGSEGYIIPNSSTNLPNYVQLRVTADVADDACTDSRCLETSDRLSRTWNSWQASTFTIDVDISDGRTHNISLYSYDFFHTGDIQNFTIKAANSSAILSSQDLSSFVNGVYQIWEISGHVTILVRGTTSPIPAIINGLFFDSPPPVTAPGYLTLPASAPGRRQSEFMPRAIPTTPRRSSVSG